MDFSPEEIEKMKETIFENIPEYGRITNKELRENINQPWTDDYYTQIRNLLIYDGKIVARKGRGGSVERVLRSDEYSVADTNSDQTINPEASNFDIENKLYEPFSKQLREKWLKYEAFDDFKVETTYAVGGGKQQKGGIWSHPDISVAGYRTFQYVPGRFLEIITYEVKTSANLNITSIYEALAHRRAANKSYVLAHMNEETKKNKEDIILEITNEAKKYGIGIIIAEDPDDADTWEEILEAERFDPEPSRLNDFITRKLSDETKESIVRWFR